ncbi:MULTISPECIES: FKBP-type peptidyl-prolyl cis-trans isomerase [unclassified Mycolicibacterium]|uniref:FKBP-type peptidyl-prolyl cis-trans isomerase n=1 Tax=unclassified Mycolicibacterium TaxID=2636767 RepID=UPI0013916D04|nr:MULTISPECIES: FKBP-type peptidyl-prolyl cis-trans isomerase [unclassified Mycolicibacterium]MUM04718.1 peptidylprolyl isomerase [Mycolicibacterium sp. CBMA 213]
MNFSRVSSSVALAAAAASLAVTLTGCGSDTKPAATTTQAPLVTTTPSSVTPMDNAATATAAERTCPTTEAPSGGTPEWTLNGATGSVAVTGSTATAAPVVTVKGPFSVNQTEVHTLQAGTGPVVPETATVSVCYAGFNGRDGSKFDSAYDRGTPATFSLMRVVPGFQKAIAGQKVGSTVAVAMTSADGYPDGQPSAGIEKGDSLVFAIKILDVSN